MTADKSKVSDAIASLLPKQVKAKLAKWHGTEGDGDTPSPPVWPKHNRDQCKKFFKREVPADLLTRINEREVIRDMLAEKGSHKPLGPVIRDMLAHREELLRRFLGLDLHASNEEVLDALKLALFDGFRVVRGDPPPERWNEAVQIYAILDLDPERSIRAASIEVQRRLKQLGICRDDGTIRTDFYKYGGAKQSDPFHALVHSGIMAPLYEYGRANPRTVTLAQIDEVEGDTFDSTLSGTLFFALRGNLEQTNRFLLAGEQYGDLTGEGDAGADVVLIDSPENPTGLGELLEGIGLTVTTFHNVDAFANVKAPTIYALRSAPPRAVQEAVNAFLADRVSKGQLGLDFDPFGWRGDHG